MRLFGPGSTALVPVPVGGAGRYAVPVSDFEPIRDYSTVDILEYARVAEPPRGPALPVLYRGPVRAPLGAEVLPAYSPPLYAVAADAPLHLRWAARCRAGCG